MELSPLHARTMALFDTVYDEYHQCTMDNVYNSAAFVGQLTNHRFKVLYHSVVRKGGSGLPPSVLQEKLKSKKGQLEARGTTKATVLKGDPKCPNLVASSVCLSF